MPVEDIQEARELFKAQEKDDVIWLMQSPAGRRIVFKWLAITGVFRSSFHADPHITAFREGARNVGLQLLAEVQQHPELYRRMQDEAATQ